MEVMTCETWRPGIGQADEAVAHGKARARRSTPVSSPGMSPKLQTELRHGEVLAAAL